MEQERNLREKYFLRTGLQDWDVTRSSKRVKYTDLNVIVSSNSSQAPQFHFGEERGSIENLSAVSFKDWIIAVVCVFYKQLLLPQRMLFLKKAERNFLFYLFLREKNLNNTKWDQNW